MTALIALTALGACSSDDSDGGDQPKSEGSPSAASESPTIYPVGGCQAKVSVTGALKVSWKGDAMATPSGDGTLYQSNNTKDSWVTVTTSGGDGPATVVVTVKGTTYAVPDKSVEIDESDNGLSASAATEVAKGKTAKLKARFTCDKSDG